MRDQASGLRQLFSERGPQRVAWFGQADPSGPARLAAIAQWVASRGERVLLIDENQGESGAVATICPGFAGYDLSDIIRRKVEPATAPWRDTSGVDLLVAHQLRVTGASRQHPVQACMIRLEQPYAYALYGCVGGPDSFLAQQAAHRIVVVVPGKRGLMEAYATVKRLSTLTRRQPAQIVVVGATGPEARLVFERLNEVAHTHLGVRLAYFGAAAAEDAESLANLLLSRMPPTVDVVTTRVQEAAFSA